MERDQVKECVERLVNTMLRKDCSGHRAVIESYCSEDVFLSHPLFDLRGREAFIALFEGWSAYNRHIDGTIHDLLYDHEKGLVMVDLTQHLVFPVFPVAQADFRMWVKFTLAETKDGRMLIVRQDDIYTARGIFRMWLPGRLIHDYIMIPLGTVAASLITAAIGSWRSNLHKKSQ